MTAASPTDARPSRPRIGFLGAGRIGLLRLKSLVGDGGIEPTVVVDPSHDMVAAARQIAPGLEHLPSFDALLKQDLDAVVIATPSALHAEQSVKALERGLAVFCQKPLGRTEAEVRAVVSAARSANRLLGLDLSYRYTSGMQKIRELVRAGELGTVFGVDLVFHNAYGPDKPWFFDKELSGGGCVMDLGVHLVDLALWALDFPEVTSVSSHLFRQGQPIARNSPDVEDFATATLTLGNGTVVRLACSWHLDAGRDAVIAADFYGTNGGASFANVNGSFFDFAAHRHAGTGTQVLADGAEDWMSRAITGWSRQLAGASGFDPSADQFSTVAGVLDRIYAR